MITPKRRANSEEKTLSSWMDIQLANITLRDGLMSKEDLTSQSAPFLHAFGEAM